MVTPLQPPEDLFVWSTSGTWSCTSGASLSQRVTSLLHTDAVGIMTVKRLSCLFSGGWSLFKQSVGKDVSSVAMWVLFFFRLTRSSHANFSSPLDVVVSRCVYHRNKPLQDPVKYRFKVDKPHCVTLIPPSLILVKGLVTMRYYFTISCQGFALACTPKQAGSPINCVQLAPQEQRRTF